MVTCTETHLWISQPNWYFFLQIQEIINYVTEAQHTCMCWQVFANNNIYNRLCVLEYIVLWTWCVILVVTIANSRPGAPMNNDVAIVDSRWRHNCCHWPLSERTSHRLSNDAIWDLRSDLGYDLSESRWSSFVNSTWLGPGHSLKWDPVRFQAKSYRKTSSISCTKSQSLNVSCILLQLPSLNPLKPGVQLRMKM